LGTLKVGEAKYQTQVTELQNQIASLDKRLADRNAEYEVSVFLEVVA
jgi:flagellar capping protein FliD